MCSIPSGCPGCQLRAHQLLNLAETLLLQCKKPRPSFSIAVFQDLLLLMRQAPSRPALQERTMCPILNRYRPSTPLPLYPPPLPPPPRPPCPPCPRPAPPAPHPNPPVPCPTRPAPLTTPLPLPQTPTCSLMHNILCRVLRVPSWSATAS